MTEDLSSLDDDIELPLPLDKGIVFFDGVCGLCNRFVDFLLRQDRDQRLRFASLQGLTARRALSVRYTLDINTVVYLKDGQSYQFSDAAVRILADLGGAWSLLRCFVLVPRFVRDGLYRYVARKRYAWFGRQETCRLPRPEEQDRLLP